LASKTITATLPQEWALTIQLSQYEGKYITAIIPAAMAKNRPSPLPQ